MSSNNEENGLSQDNIVFDPNNIPTYPNGQPMFNQQGERLGTDGKRIGARQYTSSENGLQGGRPPKVDYDSGHFYDRIYALAAQGVRDSEMASAIMMDAKDPNSPFYGIVITQNAFDAMLEGRFDKWNEIENEERSSRLATTITRARQNVMTRVRNTYLMNALGGKKLITKTTTTRKLRVDGVYTDDVEVQTTITETESQPNMGALATYMFHYDAEWRRTHRGIVPEDAQFAHDHQIKESADGVNTDIEHGVDIGSWIEKECDTFVGKDDATTPKGIKVMDAEMGQEFDESVEMGES